MTELEKLIEEKATNYAGASHWFSDRVSAEEAQRYIPVFTAGFNAADAIGFMNWYQTDQCEYYYDGTEGVWHSMDREPITTEILYLQYLKQKA